MEHDERKALVGRVAGLERKCRKRGETIKSLRTVLETARKLVEAKKYSEAIIVLTPTEELVGGADE